MKTQNIKWHPREISLEDIEKFNGHKGCVVWLTGLSASGKSTIAVATQKLLFDMGVQTILLDGDNVRYGLNEDLAFSPADRKENIRRIGELSLLLRNTGFVVLSAFISPYEKDRQMVRELIDKGHFFETYIKCSMGKCIERDPKGLYKKAQEGIIKEFTGITAPYEVPETPELIIDSERKSPARNAMKIIHHLIKKKIIED